MKDEVPTGAAVLVWPPVSFISDVDWPEIIGFRRCLHLEVILA